MDDFFIIWIVASIINCIIWMPIFYSKQITAGYALLALLFIEVPTLMLAIIQPNPIVYWVVADCVLNFLTTYVIAMKRGFYSKE